VRYLNMTKTGSGPKRDSHLSPCLQWTVESTIRNPANHYSAQSEIRHRIGGDGL